MACRAVERWTLSSVVGAYLDLVLAYLLLVGATVAFFAAKLLSLFGLSLPCSCDGQFGHPACAQTSLLVDCPASRVAAVRCSLRYRLPCDYLFSTSASSSPFHGCRHRFPIENGNSGYSVSALSRLSRSISLPEAPLPTGAVFVEPIIQGKGVPIHRRHRSRLGNLLSDLNHSDSTLEGISEKYEGIIEEAYSGEGKDSCSFNGGVSRGDEEGGVAVMRCLDRELEEERGARAALYLDLEKERSAAATAADEAMAMILRLQQEKSEIQMEAQQFKRMIEEKSAYDEEEMEILKEIIVRREREKHVLEQEVEMYRQILYSGEGVEQAFDVDEGFQEDKTDALSDDPLLMLQQIYTSVRKQDVGKGFVVDSLADLSTCLDGSNPENATSNFIDVRAHNELGNSGDECNHEFLEKCMLEKWMQPYCSNNVNSSYGEDSLMSNLSELEETKHRKDAVNLNLKGEGNKVAANNLSDADKRGSESSQPETESGIHDVHVIDDGLVLQDEQNHKQNTSPAAEEITLTNLDEMEFNIRRSFSETTNRIDLMDGLSGNALFFDLRSSMPAVDGERHKLEKEVEHLRNRLKLIRKGREKLGLPAEYKEKETIRLQLLNEISCKLKEIKKVTEPTEHIA
ncbi:hypothetical protein HPP92_009674 [Vanilla planifolia]|uniref:GTD-binding domain-containing protein n=1 Tax=Vanilla planifolia TaxID=51239 RepID=A0A835RAQ1_VANPL|nr:hypothetical protein HPP92_009674 [Vanilla planifolia]